MEDIVKFKVYACWYHISLPLFFKTIKEQLQSEGRRVMYMLDFFINLKETIERWKIVLKFKVND